MSKTGPTKIAILHDNGIGGDKILRELMEQFPDAEISDQHVPTALIDLISQLACYPKITQAHLKLIFLILGLPDEKVGQAAALVRALKTARTPELLGREVADIIGLKLPEATIV